MKDIDIAKELLQKEKLALAVVKNGEIIFTSRDRGIKPLFAVVSDLKDELKGASIADRVTGKAAAMLCEYADIKELNTRLISEKAINILEGTSIIYNYEESTPYIKNRDKTGMCPVETLSLKTNNINELIEGITNFLESINMI